MNSQHGTQTQMAKLPSYPHDNCINLVGCTHSLLNTTQIFLGKEIKLGIIKRVPFTLQFTVFFDPQGGGPITQSAIINLSLALYGLRRFCQSLHLQPLSRLEES